MNKQQIKNNLRYWFNQANEEQIKEGLRWYKDANEYVEFLYDKFDGYYQHTQIASVISALSPRNKWERNKVDAMNVLSAVYKVCEETAFEDVSFEALLDSVKVCTFNANKLKAIKIAMGQYEIVASSPKTFAFAQNVGLLDSDYVTVDVWHIRACNTKSQEPIKIKTQITDKQYQEISDITKEIANDIGIKAYEFQAVIWITIRDYWTQ